ncbi:MAG: SMC-Scp complex subunit ScpB [Phycisphaerales bacterium]
MSIDHTNLPAVATARRHEVALTGGIVAPDMIPAAIEACLLASDKPLGHARLIQALGIDDAKESKDAITQIIGALNDEYRMTARAYEIAEVAGGWRIMTRPEYAAPVAAIQGLRDSGKLSKPALETLAIIAYKQPITRAQIEAIRGVACGEVLKTLMERRLVAISGRAEELGRPMLYATTRQFLEAFGLTAVRDLPTIADVLAPPEIEPPSDPLPADASHPQQEEPPAGSDPGAGRSPETDAPDTGSMQQPR